MRAASLKPTTDNLQPQLPNHPHPIHILPLRSQPLTPQLPPPPLLPLIHNLQQLPRSHEVSPHTIPLHPLHQPEYIGPILDRFGCEAGHKEREDDVFPLGEVVGDDLAGEFEDVGD